MSIPDGLLPGRRKIRLQLGLKNKTKGFILNQGNVKYFLSNLCNLISFKLLNNSKIFYNNKNKTLYQFENKKNLSLNKKMKK